MWLHVCMRATDFRSGADGLGRDATLPKGSQIRLAMHTLWGLWLALCVIVSAPGALYAMIHSVPGFLQGSELLAWIVFRVFGLLTALLTVVLLPLCAHRLAALHSAITAVDLLGIGKMLTTLFVPGFVTVACHENCGGLWVKFWAPCLSRSRCRNPTAFDISILDTMLVEIGDRGS
eukprot:1393269-Amphidinium_carterae.1